MGQPKLLSVAFGEPLRAVGFKKRRSDTWYRDSAEIISVLNLQKSNYGRQYYVNVALWIKELGDAESPPEPQCQVRCRWECLMPENERRAARLLNMDDTSLSDEKQVSEIQRLLNDYVLPFFLKVETLADLRSLYRSDAWPNCAVYKIAEDLLR
jgi:hypothetical protein